MRIEKEPNLKRKERRFGIVYLSRREFKSVAGGYAGEKEGKYYRALPESPSDVDEIKKVLRSKRIPPIKRFGVFNVNKEGVLEIFRYAEKVILCEDHEFFQSYKDHCPSRVRMIIKQMTTDEELDEFLRRKDGNIRGLDIESQTGNKETTKNSETSSRKVAAKSVY